MAMKSRYVVNDLTKHRYTVYGFDSLTDDVVEFGFTTRAEYLAGIVEFERETYEKEIFRYKVSDRMRTVNLFESEVEDAVLVRLYVLDHLEDIANDLVD